MSKEHKKVSKPFPVWRIITGIVGALASGIALILLYKSIPTTLAIGFVLSIIFFVSFIFSPLVALLITLTIAVPAATWLMPSHWLAILTLVGGVVYTISDDKSGIRDWLLKYFPSRHKRKAKKKVYDQRSELYKTLSYFCLLLTWLVPRIDIISLGLLVLIPLLSVIRSFQYPSLAPFNSHNKKELTPTAEALLFPGAFMCVWTINNQQYNNLVWLYSGLFALLWSVLFLVFNKEYKITVLLGFMACIAIFSFGSVCNINRVYDFHPAKQYLETVTDKRISSGKSRICYVTVTPWPGEQGDSEIQVDQETYKDTEIGRKVYIVTYPGALGIGWYDLSLHPIG
jgi:hypothetical protein